MSTTRFSMFHATFAPMAARVPYDASKYDALAAKLPIALALEWRSLGFGAYGSGILWTPRPDDPILDPHDWRGLDGTGIEVLRSAFGDVCLWEDGHFRWLSIHSGNIAEFSPDAEILFASLTDKYFRNSVLLEPMFKQACKRMGRLNADECFGFSPLPALGGAIAPENLIKASVREYAAVAAQVLG